MSAQCSRSWPPEQLDALRALWASGKSASVCRWPVTVDRPWLFCGVGNSDGIYCAHHKATSVMGVKA